MANEVRIVCKNVFKSKEDEQQRKRAINEKWLELINLYENKKRHSGPAGIKKNS